MVRESLTGEWGVRKLIGMVQSSSFQCWLKKCQGKLSLSNDGFWSVRRGHGAEVPGLATMLQCGADPWLFFIGRLIRFFVQQGGLGF